MTELGTLLAAARNLAEWHDASVRALGLRPRFTDQWWSCPTPAPNIFHTAISLRPARDAPDRDAMVAELREHVDDPASAHVSVCDSWNELPVHRLGLERRAEGPWCVRSPAPLPEAPAVAAGALVIEVVHDADTLAEFERTVVVGFGARMPIAPFDIHATGVLDDPAMHVLLGRAGTDLAPVEPGHPVAVAMAYVAAGLNGIYGVATVPAARRHGFATAMTLAALDVAPEQPSMLQPSNAASSIYRKLGFVDIGRFSHWT
jgi:ribosomal protein S18 acetylase RimI-like enzyme